MREHRNIFCNDPLITHHRTYLRRFYVHHGFEALYTLGLVPRECYHSTMITVVPAV